ncbi:PTS lactose/cellobiose transporter subunit IIA [Proteinivorax tanatarense]|uniref:PTS lactose/cellobiose transporter subunit IIA n=1 Tax=Proteinivorax tanatarense TaxID=1260629 RepID=A0AAU7VMQ3_9FIRM
MDYESIILKIITHSGEAKSLCMEAIKYSKQGEIQKGRDCIEEAKQKLVLAHEVQTSLIQSEARGEKIEVSLLVVHAQDHLMNSMTVKDLAQEFIDLYSKVQRIESKVEQ